MAKAEYMSSKVQAWRTPVDRAVRRIDQFALHRHPDVRVRGGGPGRDQRPASAAIIATKRWIIGTRPRAAPRHRESL